jgi:uncharacterized coiled-coil protein SlyX
LILALAEGSAMVRVAVQGGSWNAREGEEGVTMVETVSGDMSAEILKAVQGLGARMDTLEAQVEDLRVQMKGVSTQVDVQSTRVAALGTVQDWVNTRMDMASQMRELRNQVDGLSVQMKELSTRMDKLEVRMGKQEGWMEGLGNTFHEWGDKLRAQLKQDLQEGFRQVHARVDRTDGAVVLMASVLRRPTELGEDLEKRLGELDAH